MFKRLLIFVVISLNMYTCWGSATYAASAQSLKGGLCLRPGVEEYVLLVKIKPSLNPDIDDKGALTFSYNVPSPTVQALIDRYDLFFSRVAYYSEKDLENLRTSKRHIPDEKGFNIYDFAGLLYVHTPDSSKEKLLTIANELESLDEVEYCSLDPRHQPAPPEDYPPTTPDFISRQGYRRPDPGIDIDYAWSLGLRGEGLTICDIEWSWGPLDKQKKDIHEDLIDADIENGIPMATTEYQEHGVAVVGLLVASENEYGISGSVPLAKCRCFTEKGSGGRPGAMLAAIDTCKRGDIILMEMQTTGPDGKLCPGDYDKALWDLVEKATDAGVVIVQTAGNGNANLDAPAYESYRARGDNGCIMEGAGSADTKHDKLSFSTYGKQNVHIQGWGEKVFTTVHGDHYQATVVGNDDNQAYCAGFNGTSSGGPVATSAVALIQSYAKEKLDTLLTSVFIRDLLISTGVPQGSATASTHIGPLPNIRAAIQKLDTLVTDVQTKKVNAKLQQSGLFYTHSIVHYIVPSSVPQTHSVTIKLYTIKGTLVKTMVNRPHRPGRYSVQFTTEELPMSAGVYLCSMKIGEAAKTIKIVTK